jgi:hypothetical protein
MVKTIIKLKGGTSITTDGHITVVSKEVRIKDGHWYDKVGILNARLEFTRIPISSILFITEQA